MKVNEVREIVKKYNESEKEKIVWMKRNGVFVIFAVL